MNFEALVRREEDLLEGKTVESGSKAERPSNKTDPTRDGLEVMTQVRAGEPWVKFTRNDRFGLALSGGGIRSATFNLGLLQGLHDVGVLAQVDYLSTVSGGGYVGGFWTAWRLKQRNAAADASATATAIGEAVFPVRRAPEGGSASDQNPQPPGGSAAQPATASVPNGEPEPPPIRHLREFGRFLVPRFGLFEVETWNCVVAVLGGILPSLLAATAVVVMGWLLWLVVGVVMMEGLAAGQAGLGRALAFILAVFCTGAMHASVPMLEEDRQSHERRAGVVVLFLLAGIVAVVVLRPWSFIPAATLSFLLFLETRWLSGNHASHGRRPKERVAFYGSALVAIGVTASMAIWISDWGEMPSLEGLLFDVGVNGILAPVDAGLPLILGWLAASLTLLLLRLVVLSLGRSRKAKDEDLARKAKDERLTWLRVIERNAGRMLLLALLWACVTGGWALAEWVVEEGSRRVGGLSLTTAGLISAVAWLRRWLMAPPSTSRLSSGFGRVLRMVGKAAYAVGANIALAAFVVLVATGLQLARLYGIPLVALLAVALPLILLTWLFLDPSKLGLHDFYRGRIARAFLGAACPPPTDSTLVAQRLTEEQPQDDFTLGALYENTQRAKTAAERRPLHLVCCAANNLAGDHFATLQRGARSATLSLHGVAIADHWRSLTDLSFSSALTASAAAFNSHMGRVSMDLGRSVAFLMSALNLRLGLWVPNPALPEGKARRFPGASFFAELSGASRVDGKSPEIHLSDGGHFENLGLYELVRRHCRYIIVSDCGADPTVAFDDLGNAIRRIREDFGVEIELETGPLRPDAKGRSQQHAVIGIIHYDGPNGLDKGSILYFKPTLTGDEPPDIEQYQTRNRAFPHESTADQFYDEPQWESYRRLGEHCARTILGGAAAPIPSTRWTADDVFTHVRMRWQPTFEQHGAALLNLSERLASLEANLRDKGPRRLRSEFFSEPGALGLDPQPVTAAGSDDELETISFLVSVVQLMEDVWLAANLERHWSHPLNAGWMAYLHRWAATPSLRRWWPILRPLFNPAFTEFARNRFLLRLVDPVARPHEEQTPSVASLIWSEVRSEQDLHSGSAWALFARTRGSMEVKLNRWFSYELRLAPPRDSIGKRPVTAEVSKALPGRRTTLQVGLLRARYYRSEDREVMEWRNEDFFVPPYLIGGGVTGRMLDAALAWFNDSHRPGRSPRRTLRVRYEICGEPSRFCDGQGGANVIMPRLSEAERLRRTQEIQFYKSRGFKYASPPSPDGTVLLEYNPQDGTPPEVSLGTVPGTPGT